MIWWQQFLHGLSESFADLPDGQSVGRIAGRLVLASLLCAILGIERETSGKPAGIRTHILVGLASAFFVLTMQQAGMHIEDISRVVQGIASGMGFIGAGAIIKSSDQGHVTGLTTASTLWFTTAVGVAAGMGRGATAVVGTVLALFTLSVLRRVEHKIVASRAHSE